jgi:predicted ATPase with chaperone activity
MVGPLGAGKYMLALRLAVLLPPLIPAAGFEVMKLLPVAINITEGGLIQNPPFLELQHSASMVAWAGGG